MTQSVEYIKRDETSEENESQLVWFDKNLNKLPNHLITEETSTTEEGFIKRLYTIHMDITSQPLYQLPVQDIIIPLLTPESFIRLSFICFQYNYDIQTT